MRGALDLRVAAVPLNQTDHLVVLPPHFLSVIDFHRTILLLGRHKLEIFD